MRVNPMFRHSEIEYELYDSKAAAYVGLDYLYAEVDKVKDRTGLRNIILTTLTDNPPQNPVHLSPPEAQAEKRVWLFSDESSFISEHSLVIDGGASA